MKKIIIYTDGGCRGNPGPGGWGAILEYGEYRKELKGHAEETTNNRMELTAVIEGLETLKRPCRVHIVTDSQYVKQGITQWISRWRRNGWRTAAKQQVKNRDLWERLDAALKQHQVEWEWVRGHTGHPENERADQLANKGVRTIRTGG